MHKILLPEVDFDFTTHHKGFGEEWDETKDEEDNDNGNDSEYFHTRLI